MNRSLAVVTALILAGVMSLAGAQSPRVEVALTLTAVDGTGTYLRDLSPNDLTVVEAGVTQTVTSVTSVGDAPIAFSLLLDASNSMKGEFAKAQAMAVDCVSRLRPGDVASLTTVSGRVEKRQDFTDDKARLERAISVVRQDGPTALYNAIVVTAEEFLRLGARTGNATRHVIVVLSDGIDTASLISFAQVRDVARHANATIYLLRTSNRRPTPDEAESARVAAETGGRRIAPDGSLPVEQVCARMFDDLANQHIVRYVTTSEKNDGKWRSVDVRVNLPRAKSWSRAGYFAPKSSR